MLTTDIQRLRQQSGDQSTFNNLLQSDPVFRAKVERVQEANPNMSPFEKVKFPSAMLDLHQGVNRKLSPQMEQTATMVNRGMVEPSGSPLSQRVGSYLGQTAKNILPSTGRLIGGVASAVAHPLQTGKSLLQLGVGGTANTIETIADMAGVKNAEDIFDLSSEEVANAVGDFYVQRYGSLEAAATTLRDDPAGFLSDLGAVVTGVGGAIKGGAMGVGAVTGAATREATALTAVGRGVRTAEAIGSSLIKKGINMEPLVITGKGVVMAGRGVKNATLAAVQGSRPAVLATKALKINPSDIRAFQNLPGGEMPGDFLLRKGILAGGDIAVGEEGLKMTGFSPVGRLRTGIITDLQRIADKAKATVDSVLSGVRQTYHIVDDVPPEIPKLIEEIKLIANKYDLAEPRTFVQSLIEKGNVTLSDLNELKRLAYDFFNTYKKSNVADDSFRARQIIQYERELRRFIEDQAELKGLPDIALLNQDTQKSIDLLDAMASADAASWSKGKLTLGLMDGMFGIGAYSLTGDFLSTAGIVAARKLIESTIFKTTFAKYIDKLDPSKIQMLQKAFRAGKHTTETKQILRKVVAQTADDIKNQRVADAEFNPLPKPAQSVTPAQSVMDTSPTTLPPETPPVNVPKALPQSKGLTPAEKASLTPEEKATGFIGGSDSVGGGVDVSGLAPSLDSPTFEKGFVVGDTVTMPTGTFKVGDTIDLGMAGAPPKFPKPWKLKSAINEPSSVDGANHVTMKIEAANGKVMDFKKAEIYSPSTPSPLEPLMKEARKYKSAEEFVQVMGNKHRPPDASYGASLDDLTQMYGKDIYSDNALRYYGQRFPSDPEAVRIIKGMKGKPNADITVYRAVLPEDPQTIMAGDWVTITKDYAKTHGSSVLEGMDKGGYKILSKKVKANEIFNDGNSMQEWGYRPAGHKDLTKSQLTDLWKQANQ